MVIKVYLLHIKSLEGLWAVSFLRRNPSREVIAGGMKQIVERGLNLSGS